RPGMVNGKKVSVKYNFPLNFALGHNSHIQVRQSDGPQDNEIESAIFANGKGENEFVLWVFKQITYPKIAKEQGIQGKVVASYELSEDGTVTNAKILRGVDPSIDAEAIRVLESSPKWEKPAMKNGKPVKVSYVIPLNFQLRGTSKEQINEENVKVLDDVFVVGYANQKKEINDPLYIVNGVEVNAIEDINPNSIESIEVLKGEPAVQKYGEKARKGVIIVKLK
ncbi:MAG: TonB family protein, partial [Bacteroidales bacterium]|nr:TonB family protein [Bacteroidales bacterium]